MDWVWLSRSVNGTCRGTKVIEQSICIGRGGVAKVGHEEEAPWPIHHLANSYSATSILYSVQVHRYASVTMHSLRLPGAPLSP